MDDMALAGVNAVTVDSVRVRIAEMRDNLARTKDRRDIREIKQETQTTVVIAQIAPPIGATFSRLNPNTEKPEFFN